MEQLSIGDWSLIARYLCDEVSQKDMVHLATLAHRTQNLREEMEGLRQRMNVHIAPPTDNFNADLAFDELHQKLKAEGLI